MLTNNFTLILPVNIAGSFFHYVIFYALISSKDTTNTAFSPPGDCGIEIAL